MEDEKDLHLSEVLRIPETCGCKEHTIPVGLTVYRDMETGIPWTIRCYNKATEGKHVSRSRKNDGRGQISSSSFRAPAR